MQLDERLFVLINQEWAWAPLDQLMAVMSSFALWGPFLIVAAVAILVFGGGKGRWLVVALVVVVGLTEAIFVNHLKTIVHRPRPHEVLVGTRLVALQKARPQLLALFKPACLASSSPKELRASGQSFPSGHVTDNFAAAVVLSVFFRWRGALYFLPASLVAYSRIYVGKHWPSDALASMLLGVVSALILLGLLRWLLPKIGIRMFPARSAEGVNLSPPLEGSRLSRLTDCRKRRLFLHHPWKQKFSDRECRQSLQQRTDESYPLPDQQSGEKFAAFTYLHNDAQNPIYGTAHNVSSSQMLYVRAAGRAV